MSKTGLDGLDHLLIWRFAREREILYNFHLSFTAIYLFGVARGVAMPFL